MTPKRAFWPRALLFTILGLFVGGGLVFVGFWFIQGKLPFSPVKEEPLSTSSLEFVVSPAATETPALSPSPAETTSWETYTNTKYGYQFRHPQSWIFTPSVIGDETKPLYVIRESLNSKDINDYMVEIKTWENPDQHSLLDWIQFMKDSNAFPLPAEDVEVAVNYNVGGESAFRIWSDPLSKGKEPGKCFQACPILSVYFTHEDKAYGIQLIYAREVDEASQETFTLLLSAFKFLD